MKLSVEFCSRPDLHSPRKVDQLGTAAQVLFSEVSNSGLGFVNLRPLTGVGRRPEGPTTRHRSAFPGYAITPIVTPGKAAKWAGSKRLRSAVVHSRSPGIFRCVADAGVTFASTRRPFPSCSTIVQVTLRSAKTNIKATSKTVILRISTLILTLGMVTIAAAGTINYSAVGSTLTCNGVVGCIQTSATSVSIGGTAVKLTPGSGIGVVAPSILNLASLSSNVETPDLTGLLVTIRVTLTPSGSSASLIAGSVEGSLASITTATIQLSPGNTVTAFGSLPGVVLDGFVIQVLRHATISVYNPTFVPPFGLAIQGAVSDAVPEPASLLLTGTGLLALCAVLAAKAVAAT